MVISGQLIASLTFDHALSERINQLRKGSVTPYCDCRVERQLRSSTRCVRNWAGFGLDGARDRA